MGISVAKVQQCDQIAQQWFLHKPIHFRASCKRWRGVDLLEHQVSALTHSCVRHQVIIICGLTTTKRLMYELLEQYYMTFQRMFPGVGSMPQHRRPAEGISNW